jgi:hypothetical protein
MNRVLFLFILICATPLYAMDRWEVSVVEDGWSVGKYTSIDILLSGQPAISYYDYIDGDLEYAWFEDGQWHTTTVDSTGNVGTHTSIEILQSDRPAICYLDRTENDLKYAELVGENPSNPDDWEITIVDSDIVGGYTNLEILPSGNPAISYSGIDSVRYAWSDGDKWHIAHVEDIVIDYGYTSLEILQSGKPAISYFDSINLDLKYAEAVSTTRDGSLIWEITVVDSDGDVGRYNSLKELSSGAPAISYYAQTGGNLKYAWFENGSWRTTIVDSVGNVGKYTSLEVLPEDDAAANHLGGSEQINLSGQPVISYSGSGDLKFAWFDGVEWQVCLVETFKLTGEYTSMVIMPTGQPAISYYNSTYGTLKYAWFVGFGWYTTAVDKGKWEGEHTSLTFLPSDKPVISYFDRTNQDLMCAELVSENPAGLKQWRILPVESNGNVGEYASIDIWNGQPAISYYKMSGQDLRFAWFDGGEWQTIRVDNPAYTGLYSSVAISPVTGQPAISYTSNDDLRYAWFDGSAWHADDIVVDGEGDVGYYTSLDFLPSGKPVISYRDNTNTDLKYAELVGEDPSNPDHWLLVVVDQFDNVGQYTSIAIWNDQPAISYYDATNQDLKFAWFDGSKWRTTIVDDGQNTGTYSSLAIVSGKPAISYYSEGDLKYAELVGSDPANPNEWEITIVDAGGGTYTSLTTSLSGDPAISYYHAGTGDLKYARRFSE